VSRGRRESRLTSHNNTELSHLTSLQRPSTTIERARPDLLRVLRMNWTGGKLQRSKQANKGIAQIQKAHFARARTQLQNNSNALTTPLPSSFFREAEDTLGSQLPPCTARTVRHVGHSRTLQHGSAHDASPPRAQTNIAHYERPPPLPNGGSISCSHR
jgi:hypothetical protein